MNIKLLKSQDKQVLEEYLGPQPNACLFAVPLKLVAIDDKGEECQGDDCGYVNTHDQRRGVIAYYWNGNVMMHAGDHDALEKLILHLKKNIIRPIAGILGPNIQAEHVINTLGLSQSHFGINSNEGLTSISKI